MSTTRKNDRLVWVDMEMSGLQPETDRILEIVSLSYPKPREGMEKVVKVVRTDTTAFVGAWLPKDTIITGSVS